MRNLFPVCRGEHQTYLRGLDPLAPAPGRGGIEAMRRERAGAASPDVPAAHADAAGGQPSISIHVAQVDAAGRGGPAGSCLSAGASQTPINANLHFHRSVVCPCFRTAAEEKTCVVLLSGQCV
ncbi:hypothetical protein U9M48_014910 [Paspalum notatum var. saurae]|uniref:Uncharacterized protein n=1 Tax=Paspalum notatum var. saurae TaxID=547442 RepID=A0AAQ3T458_PASNO